MLTPVSRKWLGELSPGLGGVSILPGPDTSKGTLRLHESEDKEDDSLLAVPLAANELDMELLWFSEIPRFQFGEMTPTEVATLGVHSRLSAVLNAALAQKIESKLPIVLYFIVAVFLFVEVISIYIGVSLTRTITGAVNDLYEGTQRVMKGDFSHRIAVKGDDQIAELSIVQPDDRKRSSAPRIAKENERMQAELEIARQEQQTISPHGAEAEVPGTTRRL